MKYFYSFIVLTISAPTFILGFLVQLLVAGYGAGKQLADAIIEAM